MIQDFEVGCVPPVLHADLCIVGAGIAGLTIAQQFVHTRWSVLVIEGGGVPIPGGSDNFFPDAEIAGNKYRGHIEGRFRGFGGSSVKWGGALLPLSNQDFRSRPYVEHSGWPITLDDLLLYYKRAEAVCHVDSLPYDEALQDWIPFHRDTFGAPVFRFRYSKWLKFKHRNFARTVGADCARAANITLLLHATAVSLDLDENGTRVRGATIRSPTAKTANVQAKHFVLCCGTLETTRLLLVSNDVASSGIGNDRGLVGRFFQDHVSYRAAELLPARPRAFARSFFARFRRGIMRYPRLEFTEQAQDRLQCLSAFGQILLEAPERSGFSLVRDLLRGQQAGQIQSVTLRDFTTAASHAPYILSLAKAYCLGGLLPIPPGATWILQVDVEQEPSPASTVSLSDERDAFGMPKLRIHWKIGERERQTVQSFVAHFQKSWEANRLGRARWNPSIDTEGPDWLTDATDAFHQAGTTRMSDSPATGVVDANLRVHTVSNLHVASCSVFPTSGSANPTFTLIALCLRLSDRLKDIIDLPGAVVNP